MIIFLDPHHADITHGRSKPRQGAGEFVDGDNSGDGIDEFRPAEINAALLPVESFALHEPFDFAVGIIIGIAIGLFEDFDIEIESDGVHTLFSRRWKCGLILRRWDGQSLFGGNG